MRRSIVGLAWVWMCGCGREEIILEPGTWNQPAAGDLGGFPCGWAGLASACRTDLQSACAHGCRRRHRAIALGRSGTCRDMGALARDS